MVEKTKDAMANNTIGTKENKSGSESLIRNREAKQYGWMFDGESVIAEIPVKEVIYLKPKKKSNQGSSPGFGAEKVKNLKKPKMEVKKTDVATVVATDQRVVFLDKKGDLFEDGGLDRIGAAVKRQFFFYNPTAFENYLAYAAKNNERVLEEYKQEHGRFAASFDKKGMAGTVAQMHSGKLRKAGYIDSVLFMEGFAFGTEKEYKKGTIGRGTAYKILKSLGSVQAASSIFDSKKKGISLELKIVDLGTAELSNAYAEQGKNIRAKLSSSGLIRPAGFFVLPEKGSADAAFKFANSIVDKVNDMATYAEKEAAMEAIARNFLRKEGQ